MRQPPAQKQGKKLRVRQDGPTSMTADKQDYQEFEDRMKTPKRQKVHYESTKLTKHEKEQRYSYNPPLLSFFRTPPKKRRASFVFS
jgi:hypothetical protein